VLGGRQGIGKDTILEPVKHAIVNVGVPVPTSLDTANPVAVLPGTPAG
jgi:hypothetical protein